MKRVYKSPATPERLRSYVKAFPDETWELSAGATAEATAK